jgi:hypothetical protein
MSSEKVESIHDGSWQDGSQRKTSNICRSPWSFSGCATRMTVTTTGKRRYTKELHISLRIEKENMTRQ